MSSLYGVRLHPTATNAIVALQGTLFNVKHLSPVDPNGDADCDGVSQYFERMEYSSLAGRADAVFELVDKD